MACHIGYKKMISLQYGLCKAFRETPVRNGQAAEKEQQKHQKETINPIHLGVWRLYFGLAQGKFIR